MIVGNYSLNRRENKTVIITGSTQGIGKSTALRFAREGYQVVVNCRSEKKYQEGMEVVKECKELYNRECVCLVADVSRASECKKLVESTVELFGKIDVLINNAGIIRYSLLHRTEEELYREIIMNNQDSVFFMMKYATQYMLKEKKGVIINVTSVASMKGTQCLVAYSASKGAIISITKAAAAELALKNIRVNAVAPGMVDTTMTDFLTEKQFENACKQISMNRFATSEEIADSIYWLSTDQSKYVTGHVLEISGGM